MWYGAFKSYSTSWDPVSSSYGSGAYASMQRLYIRDP